MNNILIKLLGIVKSRTVWTVIALVLINGIPAVASYIPESVKPIVDTLLGLLAVYFRVNPKQEYNG
jgi:hypothetical protein